MQKIFRHHKSVYIFIRKKEKYTRSVLKNFDELIQASHNPHPFFSPYPHSNIFFHTDNLCIFFGNFVEIGIKVLQIQLWKVWTD